MNKKGLKGLRKHLLRTRRKNTKKFEILPKVNKFVTQPKKVKIKFITFDGLARSKNLTPLSLKTYACSTISVGCVSQKALKVYSSHLNWGARLYSFDLLLKTRCPASF